MAGHPPGASGGHGGATTRPQRPVTPGVSPQVITPEEIVDPNVDEHSVMTYLSQFPKAKLKPGAPLRPKLNPKKARAYGPGEGGRDPQGCGTPVLPPFWGLSGVHDTVGLHPIPCGFGAAPCAL